MSSGEQPVAGARCGVSRGGEIHQVLGVGGQVRKRGKPRQSCGRREEDPG